MKTGIILLAIVIFIAMACGITGFLKALRVAQTNETLALIIATASNYKGDIKDLKNGQFLVTQIHAQYPNVTIYDGTVLDAWKHPIKIQTTEQDNKISIMTTSSGPDGVIGSKDDIIKSDEFDLK